MALSGVYYRRWNNWEMNKEQNSEKGKNQNETDVEYILNPAVNS